MSVTNSVRLIGRLVKNPELKYGSTSQKPYCRFRLASDRPVSNEKALIGAATTDYVDCVAFAQNAEYMTKFLVAGDTIALEATLETVNQEVHAQDSATKEYVYRGDGTPVTVWKTFTTVVAGSVQSVGARRQADARTQSYSNSVSRAQTNPRLAPITRSANIPPAPVQPELRMTEDQDPYADSTPDARELAGV